jgi:hypothetical protein
MRKQLEKIRKCKINKSTLTNFVDNPQIILCRRYSSCDNDYSGKKVCSLPEAIRVEIQGLGHLVHDDLLGLHRELEG